MKLTKTIAGIAISTILLFGGTVIAHGGISDLLPAPSSSQPQKAGTFTVEKTTTLWSGEQTVEGWSGAQQFTAAACADIKAGDRIAVTCTQILSDTQSQVDLRNGSGWSNFSPALNIRLNGLEMPYEAVFTLTEEVAGLIRANGMVVTGKDFVFTRVALKTDVETSDPSQKGDYARTVWEGNEFISWVSGSSNSFLIKNADLGAIKAGDIIRVHYKDMTPGAVGRILANWTALTGISNATLNGTRFYEYTLTEEWVGQIAAATGLRVSGNNYTATKVEVIDPAKQYLIQAEVDGSDIRAWEAGENPDVTVRLQNLESIGVDALVEVVVDHDCYTSFLEKSETVNLGAGEEKELDIPIALTPGFYNLHVYVNGNNICSYVIGSEPGKVISAPDSNLADIRAYWENELDILAGVPLDAELTLIESASTANRNVYLVKMKSTPDTYGGEPVEIRGFYAEPVEPGRYPALIQYQGTDGGSSAIKPIGGDDNVGWCELVISTRGQMLNNRTPESCEWAWLDPAYTRKANGSVDYYAHGFGDKEKHYYRGGNVDCIRAIDFMESREKVHPDNIFAVGGSQGGSFVYVAAALGNGRIRAAAPSITGHSDFADCVKIVSWPGNVFAARKAELGMTDDEMWEFLSFYDVRNLAPMVNCPVITSFSLQDRTDPPHINVAPFNNIDRTGLSDNDFQYVVNPFLGHATASDWKSRYMEFFNRYRTDIEPFDPSTPVIEAWKGECPVDWTAGDTNSWLSVSAEQFRNASAGSVLRVCLSDLSLGAQGHLLQGNWADLADAKEYLPLSGASFSFEITEQMLDQLKRNGLIVTGIGFTARKVEIVNYANLPDVSAAMVEDCVKVWGRDETPAVGVTLSNNEDKDADVNLAVLFRTDDYLPAGEDDRSVTIPARSTITVSVPVSATAPGFYHATVSANHKEIDNFNFGIAMDEIDAGTDMAADFDTFWSDALASLAGTDMNAGLTLIPEKCTEARNVYLLEMQSAPDREGGDPVIIRGYYAEPTAEGTYPALITYQGYDSDPGSTPWCPGGDDRIGWVELIISTRGQMLNNRAPYTNPYGDWFVSGFGDPASYYYRGAYLDAVRAIDFIASREKVQKSNIFAQGQSQGGALTIAAAALGGGRLRAIAPAIQFMGDFPRYFKVGNWPAYQARIKRDELGLTDEQMYEALAYFDAKNLATRVECPAISVIGLQDNVCPPHTNVASFNNLNSTDKEIHVNPRMLHSTHSGWDNQFMTFFSKHMGGASLGTDEIAIASSSNLRVSSDAGCIHISSTHSLVRVTRLSGITVYQGIPADVPVSSPGVYIVNAGTDVCKVFVE